MSSSTRKLAGTASVVLALLLIAPVAMAQQSSVDAHGGTGGKVQSAVSNPGPSADPQDPGGLPFTGFDVALLFSGGVVLIAAGAVMAPLLPRTQRL